MRKVFRNLVCVGAVLSIVACGGSGGDDSPSTPSDPAVDPVVDSNDPIEPSDARVVRLVLDNNVLPLGSVGVLSVEPTYAESRVAAGERVVIVVRFPFGVGYQAESAGIQTASGSVGVGSLAVPCADGSSYITIDLGSAELSKAQDPDGAEDADARIVLGVEAQSNTGAVRIQAAAADNSLSASCEGAFDQEAEVEVVVQ